MKGYRLPGERNDESGLDRLTRDLCRYFNGSEIVNRYHRHTPLYLTRMLLRCGLKCSTARAREARRAPPFTPHTTRRTPETEAVLHKVAKIYMGLDIELFFAPDPEEQIMLRLSSAISHRKPRLSKIKGKRKIIGVRAIRPSDSVDLAYPTEGTAFASITGDDFNKRIRK